MTDTPPVIALLVDADNAALDSLDQVLAALAKQGQVQIRRAYGNWFKTALRSWDAELNRHRSRAIQQTDPVKGEPQIALSQGLRVNPATVTMERADRSGVTM